MNIPTITYRLKSGTSVTRPKHQGYRKPAKEPLDPAIREWFKANGYRPAKASGGYSEHQIAQAKATIARGHTQDNRSLSLPEYSVNVEALAASMGVPVKEAVTRFRLD